MRMKKYILLVCSLFSFILGYSQTILVNATTNGGFESGTTFAANGWTVVNGSQTNKWFVGSTGVPFAGTRCAYISNNGTGSTYNYINATSVVHFYRDITFPAGETNIQLSFRWKGQGESCCDYLKVFLVPTSTTPVAGTQLTSGQIGGNLNMQGAYQLANFILPCSAAGTTMRLVFSWRNNGYIGTQPPGAIDNIQVTSALPSGCPLGTGVTNIASLPYSSGSGTTCGQVNDFTSTNTTACGSTSYLGGEDRVWVFTPTASGDITITLTSSGSYTGLMLYQGCPNCGTCIAYAQSSTGNKTMCAYVIAGQTYYLILDSYPLPTCNAYTDLSITSPSAGFTACGMSTYTVSSIPYAPETWTTGTTVPGLTTDDVFSSAYIPLGFNFCYDGQTNINQGLISANGYIIFDSPTCSATNLASGSAAASAYSGYIISANIPNTTEAPRNSILGIWVDMDPSVGGTIRRNLTGIAPNRIFTVKWDNVPMFSSACNSLLARTQIRLFEQNSAIEVHIGNKPSCPDWNNNYAICGLHNYNGTQAVVPASPNRNAIPAWPSTTNEAWRFTTTCATCLNLALEISDFKGEVRNDKVYLQWSAGELNTQTFFVERSTDGVTYFPVNDQNYTGAGTYLSMDAQPIPGKTFYRVYAKTKDGGYIYGNPIEIDYTPKHVNSTILALYPNPVQDEIKLDMYFPTQINGELEVLDMYGKVVKRMNIGSASGRYTISVSTNELSNGFYMVRFHDGKQYSETYKFMKQ